MDRLCDIVITGGRRGGQAWTDSKTLLQQGEDKEDKHGPTLGHCYNREKIRRTSMDRL